MSRDRLPPLSALRAFEAAARTASLSAAGRELNVTHAAVGQQVRRLEAQIGVTLLERVGRGVAPTPAGSVLANGLTDAFDRMRLAVESAMTAEAGRPLRVSTTPSFAMSWLMPRLGAFRAANPGIEIMINPSAEVVDLIRERYDIAIRYGDGHWPGLESEPLVQTDFIVVAAPKLIARHPVATPADLLALPWLQELGTDEMMDWLRRQGVDVDSHADTAHLPGYMVLEAARAGQGVACSARVNVEQDIATGALVALFAGMPGSEATGYHMVRAPGAMRPSLGRFVDWLRDVRDRDPSDPPPTASPDGA